MRTFAGLPEHLQPQAIHPDYSRAAAVRASVERGDPLAVFFPLGAREYDSTPGFTEIPAGAFRSEPDPPQPVTADPEPLDTQTDGNDSDTVHRGTNATTLDTPTERADAVRSAAVVPGGWVAPTDLRPNVGQAATAESVAPKGSAVAAWEQRPAAMRDGGGNAGSAAAFDRTAWLARVQRIDPRERKA